MTTSNAMTASTRIWFIGAPLLCALIPLVCVPAAEWLAVAPHGSDAFLWLMFLFVFPALAAVPAILGALVQWLILARSFFLFALERA